MPSPLPAIFSGEGTAAYQEWLPVARTGSLAGSFDSEDIEDFYLTPYDLGYGRSVAFDHDFIGRAALERHAADQKRVKVTLVWNPEDVAAAVRSLFEPGIPAKYIDFPKARYGQHQVDRVLRDGQDVGISHDVGYITNEHAFVSLASIETRARRAGHRGRGGLGRGAEFAQAGGRAAPPGRRSAPRCSPRRTRRTPGRTTARAEAPAGFNPRDRIGAARARRTQSRGAYPSRIGLVDERMPSDGAACASGDVAQGADHAQQVIAHGRCAASGSRRRSRR